MCKAAQLPASVIANIDIPFRGRIFKVAGDRTIEPWSITIINDEDFRIRKAMEEWVDLIAKLENNLGATDPSAYMVNAKVFQLGRGSTPSSRIMLVIVTQCYVNMSLSTYFLQVYHQLTYLTILLIQ